MSKLGIERKHARFRRALKERRFSIEQFVSAVEDLRNAEVDSEDPYPLEGALEVIAESLLPLFSDPVSRKLAAIPLGEVLHHFVKTFGCGKETEEAAEELQNAMAASWYDESDEDLEELRDQLVNELDGLRTTFEQELKT
jgi:hypothetical protein